MTSATDAVRNTLPASVEKLLPDNEEKSEKSEKPKPTRSNSAIKDVTRPGAAGTRKPEIQETSKLGGIPMLYDPVLNRGKLIRTDHQQCSTATVGFIHVWPQAKLSDLKKAKI